MSNTKTRGKGPEAVVGIISMRGVEGVGELHRTGAVSQDSIRKAIKVMREAGHPMTARVEDWYAATFAVGAAALQIGETRHYKLQASKSGRAFFKMPVPDAEPGQVVAVTRQKDRDFSVAVVPG